MIHLLKTPRSAILVIGGGLLFLVAVLFALFRLLLPLLPALQEQIEARASEMLGAPVEIGEMDSRWSGFGPELEFRDVALVKANSSGDELLSFSYMRVGLYLTDLLVGRVRPREIELSGLRLVVEKRADGGIQIRGLSRQSQDRGDFIGGLLEALKRKARWEFNDTQVIWVRETINGIQPGQLSIFDISVQTNGDIVTAEMTGTPPDGIARDLTIRGIAVGDLDKPETLPFELDVEADGLNLSSPWLSDYVPFAARLRDGKADLFMSLEWRGRRLLGAIGDVEARELLGMRSTLDDDRLGLSGTFSWQPSHHGWDLALADTSITYGNRRWPTREFRIERDLLDNRLTAEAAYIDLADVKVLAESLLTDKEDVPDQLERYKVFGVLQDVAVSLQQKGKQWQLLSSTGSFDGLALMTETDAPGFSGLSGHWRRDGNAGLFHLDSADVLVDAPMLYDDTLNLTELSGVLEWTDEQAEDGVNAGAIVAALPVGAKISSDDFKLVFDGVTIDADFDLALAKDKAPDVDIALTMEGLDVPTVRKRLPLVIPDRARNWLQAGLIDGYAEDVSLKLTGDPRQFPFAEGGGELKASLLLKDATFSYQPEWPSIENMDARIEFLNQSLRISDGSGVSRGAKISNASAYLDDLFTGAVKIDVTATADVPRALEIARTTPLQKPLEDVLDRLTGSGDVKIGLDVTVPVKNPDDMTVLGTVALSSAQLERSEEERLTDIHGAVAFDYGPSGTLVTADSVKARYLGLPLALNLRTRAGEADIAISASGVFDLADPAAHQLAVDLTPEWLVPNLAGKVNWTADLSGTESHPPATLIKIQSDLVGLTSALPYPLGKAVETPINYEIEIDRQVAGVMQVRYDMEGKAAGNLWLHRNERDEWALERGRLTVGQGDLTLPEQTGLSVAIQADALNLDRWIDRMGGWAVATGNAADPENPNATAEPSPLHQLSLSTAHLRAFELDWSDVSASVDKQTDGWLATLASAEGEGTVGIADDEAQPLQVALSRLALNDLIPTQADPGGETFKTAQMFPQEAPEMDVVVDDFRFKTLSFGKLEANVRNTLTGMEISRLAATGGQVNLEGNVRWDYVGEQHFSELRLKGGSKDLHRILEDLGYEGTVSAEDSRFDARFQWPGPLSSPELATMGGEVWMRMDDGTLYGVDPGPGRVFGLLSFYTLPRRFLLDFRDLVEPGLQFDKITGNFTLNAGNAWTDDLTVRAPGMRLKIVGRTGLEAQDYDQYITVSPDVSTGVVLAATALQGFGIGAVLLLGQELLGRPLSDVGQLHYHLHGSWDEPMVGDEPVSMEAAKPREAVKPHQRSPRRRRR